MDRTLRILIGEKREKGGDAPSTQPTLPPGKDIEGQWAEERLILCPWCKAAGWMTIDTEKEKDVSCWNCRFLLRPRPTA